MTVKLKPLLINIFIPLAVGGFSALLTSDSMKAFGELNQPPLSPPAWLFPVVWSILYILMGIAAYLVFTSNASKDKIKNSLIFYAIQLIFNFFWSLIFFNMQAYLFAFFWLLAMLAFIVITTVLFYKISKPAGIIMIPYIIWVTFAGYLNFAIFLLNR